MFSRVLFSVAVCLAVGGEALMAHDPHDPIITVAVSPNYAQDYTAFATTDYLSLKLGVFALLKSTNGGVTWSAVSGLPNVRKMLAVVFSPAYSQDQTVFVAGLGGLYKTRSEVDQWGCYLVCGVRPAERAQDAGGGLLAGLQPGSDCFRGWLRRSLQDHQSGRILDPGVEYATAERGSIPEFRHR